jgi:ssRNA-specific RNase YbeY (16S rRNA maturation enzyme)
MLHLVGLDDVQPALRRQMRVAEKKYLAHFLVDQAQIAKMSAEQEDF